MFPVAQEFLHDPANGVEGDCYRACLASILELPITDVPHFAQVSLDTGTGFTRLIWEWLRTRELNVLTVYNPPAAFPYGVGVFDELYYIVSGPSPRNPKGRHAVVYLDEEMVWDPHPSKSGILTDDPRKVRCDFIVSFGATAKEYK